jgi:hypothetical protein
VANTIIENILLVEGESDIKFFDSLIKFMELTKPEIDPQILKFDTINGSDNKSLTLAIKSLEVDIRNSPIKNFGIIMDLDEYSNENRVDQIQKVLIDIFGSNNVTITDKNNFNLTVNTQKTIHIYCYFIQDQIVNNLELLLQNIVTEKPIAANCLKYWKECVDKSDRKVRNSDYLKFWREIYIRYDYCANKELLKHASENCTTDKSYENMLIETKKKAWDFDKSELDDLKVFLSKFATREKK